jgi:hypothetical protein
MVKEDDLRFVLRTPPSGGFPVSDFGLKSKEPGARSQNPEFRFQVSAFVFFFPDT